MKHSIAALGFLAFLAPFARAQSPQAPQLSLAAEEPTGVLYDRDFLGPQTPVLFAATLKNPSSEAREIKLAWRITDARGKTLWERNATFSVNPNAQIVRRELFDVPARGGFLLETTATSRLKGADAVQKASLPFAVLNAPPATETAGLRPQSFFILSAPANLTGTQLDFYARLGARVLRSPLPADPTKPDWPALENQLGERIKRNLATVAQIPLDEKRSPEAYFARSVPANLARYGALQTWELSGDVSPADLDAWSQVLRSRRRDVALLGPVPSGLPPLPGGATLKLSALDAATFEWPRGVQAHPAALRRLWLSRAAAAKNAGLSAFHLRRESSPARNAQGAASSLTADYLSAIMAGASSMAETLPPPSNDQNGAVSLARGAAFAMLSRTLEDAAFKEQLFPQSPALEGALFSSPRGATAILYAPLGEGKMSLRAAPSAALDAFGNVLSRDKNGVLSFEIGDDPVYLVSQTATDVLSYALKTAKFEGIAPFRAQILPLSRDPRIAGPGTAAIRVRVQNVGVGPKSGRLRLDVPKGWKLASRDLELNLAEGESKTFEFRATQVAYDPKWGDAIPFEAEINGNFPQDFKLNAPFATAQGVEKGASLKIDGALDDWAGALWQSADSNAAGVRAGLALKWDKNNLYVAARVNEASLQPRRADESSFEFWEGHDALQIAFGFSEGDKPSVGPFRDSDRGFLLAPFTQRGPRDFDGRVLRLFGPEQTISYGRVVDRVRWGGNVAGSKLALSRDEANETTIYEAQIPFAALPELKPQDLAERDGAVRFGWLLHNDEGTPLDWGRSLGNFAWWENTSTFFPEGVLTSSLRATLGFTLGGDLADGPATSPVAPTTAPAPARIQNSEVKVPAIVPLPLPTSTPKPVIKATPKPAPTPKPTPRPALPPPPTLLPAPVPEATLAPLRPQISPANPSLLPPANAALREEQKELAPFVVP